MKDIVHYKDNGVDRYLVLYAQEIPPKLNLLSVNLRIESYDTHACAAIFDENGSEIKKEFSEVYNNPFKAHSALIQFLIDVRDKSSTILIGKVSIVHHLTIDQIKSRVRDIAKDIKVTFKYADA